MNYARLRLVAAVLAVSGAFLMAYQATNAAFSAQTGNTGNAFSAGTVSITDDDAGGAMFSASNLAPGDTVVGCIEVTYTGSLDAAVRLYGAVGGGSGLEAYLDLQIERSTGDCSAFGSAIVVWDATDGDLGAFMTAAGDYATGVDSWAPTGGAPDDTVPYRFTVTLQDQSGAQGESAVVGFTWEARNT